MRIKNPYPPAGAVKPPPPPAPPRNKNSMRDDSLKMVRPFFGLPPILDACCGSRMMWFDRENSDVLYVDHRRETLKVSDRSHGKTDGTRTVNIDPDELVDFRDMPYPDCSFRLVVFDPPHLVRAGPRSWMAAKYGKLGPEWKNDLRRGFDECFRVLKPEGVLVFKWNETQVPAADVLSVATFQPLFGHRSGRKAMTHWYVFMKPGI